MKRLLDQKYLTLPINELATVKKVCLYENGTLIADYDCKLDMRSPTFTAYIDVSRFAGRIVEITVSPEMDFAVGAADDLDLPGLWHETLRPRVHFTVANGWNNDPNGLIFYHGEYHMFYQYNPCSTEWGNMHWGHAVSRDLLHWEHRDTALFPDETGTMYSGSAIEDIHNLTGLQTGEKSTMLLYYTAAGNGNLLSKGVLRTQCLAYSTDGGRTFEKYEGNPLVPWFEAYNRDPKVVWVEELEKYLLILYLQKETYRMLVSDDLLQWEFFEDLELHGDNECPDIYPLECEGKRYWIISGARDIYVVGRFTKTGFLPEGEEKRLSYSAVSYAAQSYSGTENRVVRVSWNRLKIPGKRFSQQMGIPVEMRLDEIDGKHYLSALPIRELETLRERSEYKTAFMLSAPLRFEAGENPIDLSLSMQYDPNARLTLRLFGAELKLNLAENQLRFGNVTLPVSILQERLELRVVVDRCSIEVFGDNGRFCVTLPHFCDYNLPYAEIRSESVIAIDRVECHTLRSIYQ